MSFLAGGFLVLKSKCFSVYRTGILQDRINSFAIAASIVRQLPPLLSQVALYARRFTHVCVYSQLTVALSQQQIGCFHFSLQKKNIARPFFSQQIVRYVDIIFSTTGVGAEADLIFHGQITCSSRRVRNVTCPDYFLRVLFTCLYIICMFVCLFCYHVWSIKMNIFISH